MLPHLLERRVGLRSDVEDHSFGSQTGVPPPSIELRGWDDEDSPRAFFPISYPLRGWLPPLDAALRKRGPQVIRPHSAGWWSPPFRPGRRRKPRSPARMQQCQLSRRVRCSFQACVDPMGTEKDSNGISDDLPVAVSIATSQEPRSRLISITLAFLDGV